MSYHIGFVPYNLMDNCFTINRGANVSCKKKNTSPTFISSLLAKMPYAHIGEYDTNASE